MISLTVNSISIETYLSYDSLCSHYFFEDAFLIIVGIHPSFFDLWLDLFIMRIPQSSKSLDDMFEQLIGYRSNDRPTSMTLFMMEVFNG